MILMVFAYLVDIVILACLSPLNFFIGLGYILILLFMGQPNKGYLALPILVLLEFVIFVLTFLMYYLFYIFIPKRSMRATCGKLIYGLRVIREDGNIIHSRDIIEREFYKTLLFPSLIPSLIMLFRKDHLTIHDKRTHTRVVRKSQI